MRPLTSPTQSRTLARPSARASSTPPPVSPTAKRLASRRARRHRNEGLRGVSVRATVVLRYVAYWFTIVIGGAVAHFCFKSVPEASSG
jgi:hypothetical protein